MKLVWLIGPHAVGKMTVGQELAKMTGLNLFHNHMSIELAVAVLGQRPNTWQLVRRIREAVFDEALECPDLPGLIFTYMCAFDDPADVNYVREVSGQFGRRALRSITLNSRLKSRCAWSATRAKTASRTSRQNGISRNPKLFFCGWKRSTG